MSIYDLIIASEIVTYWEGIAENENENDYMFEPRFPGQQKLGLKIEWILGADGLPIALKPSAFGVKAIPRDRIGVETLEAKMPFFKESMYIDEEFRQQLNMLIESNNENYVKVILNRIFNDEVNLLRGARVQRERMRAMLVTTGTIMIEGNGQVYEYDYHMPENHKKTVAKSWSDPSADIMEDIRSAINTIEEDTGVRVRDAVMRPEMMAYFRSNTMIRTTLAPLIGGEGFISDSRILQLIEDELNIRIRTNGQKFKDEKRQIRNMIPENVFSMFPEGQLGTTWFGVTPEQSDLMSGQVANVAITDIGVAVTTTEVADPVTVETKVSQICLPDLPTANQIFIFDVVAEENSTPPSGGGETEQEGV